MRSQRRNDTPIEAHRRRRLRLLPRPQPLLLRLLPARNLRARCRARARLVGLPVGDGALVGALGLQREFAFGLAHCLVRRPDVAPRTSCARRASRRRIARTRSSGVQTPSSSPAHNSLAKVRASSRSVLARAWRMPVSLGETTITRATCGSRIRAIAHALPVTSNATQSPASRLWANSSSASGRVRIRPAERSRPSATIATLQKSRWTSSATALTDSSSPSLTRGEPVGKRHRRIRARSATRQVAGAATEKPGLEAHRAKRPTQPWVLPKAPVPVGRT